MPVHSYVKSVLAGQDFARGGQISWKIRGFDESRPTPKQGTPCVVIVCVWIRKHVVICSNPYFC
jgi:hypothetical protein